MDLIFYEKVVYACALKEDFKSFPNGNQSIIGSNGITLSGGQKQRVVSLSPFISAIESTK